MSKINSVSLIFPKSRSLNSSSIQWMPPLGMLSLATFLRKENPEIEINVINEEVEKPKKDFLNADLIGFSPQISSYENTLNLAETAHNNGAKVVFGGPYASVLSERIIKKREFIDGIIVGTGEYAINEIVNGRDFFSVPNLVFLHDGKIIRTKYEQTNFNLIPFPDRSFIDLEPYFKNFRKTFPSSEFKRPTTFFSQRGCFWSNINNGCIFCSRKEKYQFKNPSLVWKEVKYLEETYGVDYLDDESDNYSQNIVFLKQLLEQKPETDIKFRVWARTDQITEENAKLFSSLGVHDVFLGVESGDAECLKNLNKETTPENNLNAARILNKYNIKTFVFFVLGAPHESRKSLAASIVHAKQLIDIGNLETLDANILLPLPGSTSFEMLSKKIAIEGDLMNPLQLEKEWVKNFTDVSWEEINNCLDQIADMPIPRKHIRKFSE